MLFKKVHALIFISLNIIFSNFISIYANQKDFVSKKNGNLISKIKREELPTGTKSDKVISVKISKGETSELKKSNDIFNKEIKNFKLNSFNRSIIFNNKIVGPDISWLVPPGFKWTTKYKFDLSTRGHNRRKKGEPLLGWNGGDAVGQIYYHPIFFENYSFGLNMGIRSVYSGSAPGGQSTIGEGQSLGFRIDKRLSNNSGMSIGGEQLLHFDGMTDTGRDLYMTFSKGWWPKDQGGLFPLNVATFGFATGKMAEGNIKGLCSDLFGGSGTEVEHQRRLCWSPVFALSRVYNSKISTFFEYNSKWFLLGTSIAPYEEIPLRGTFAIQLSDHVDNYKLNNFDELMWVFRVSIGI